MSDWHRTMQRNFKDTEKPFNKKNGGQIKNRRADVFLNARFTLEVQHSDIEEIEVIERYEDYKLHNTEVIWLIDGNTNDVILYKISNGTYLIEFNKGWKYKSFICKYEYILLDINGQIFKIPVKSVCNKLFHAKSYISLDNVINTLTNNPENIWDLWPDTNEIKPILKIIQKGAGNGKTFGIWKCISVNFDKELNIITTKQHTAKEVILEELNKQAERQEFHIIDNMTEIVVTLYNRQYIVTYKHNYSNRECKIIIGTIDSFINSLTSKSTGCAGFFEGLLNNICNNGCDKISNTGEIYYAGQRLKLNKRCELTIDESQDLPIDYYKAIIKLMLTTKIDCVIVGDKLQSLKYEKNFMTHIENNPFINIIREKPENINRRIKVKYMAEKINDLIHFEQYGLPKVTIEEPEKLQDMGVDVVQTFIQDSVYANDTNTSKINNLADYVVNIVKENIVKFGFKPKDFHILFPIMKGNILADELVTKLTEMILGLDIDSGSKDVYEPPAVLHKHEEGQVIDTSTSTNSVRIMSVAASKGDGRAITICLNFTEQALKLVSNNEINILYESHLHVALTRAEYKIYFGLQLNNDDIHRRFASVDANIEYIPRIRNSLKLDTLTQYIDMEHFIKLGENSKIIMEKMEKIEKEETTQINNTNSTIVDWEYHCIRRAIYLNYAFFEIFKHNKHNKLFEGQQMKVVFDIISKLKIKKLSPKDFYNYLDSTCSENLNELPEFPLCDLSHKEIYQKIYTVIYTIIKKIQTQYKEDNLSIGNLSALESSILIYLIDIFKNKKYHTISPVTVYNIVNSFEKKNNIQELLVEAENIKSVLEKLMCNINCNTDVKWNIEHLINFDGNTDHLKLHNKFNIIGNDKERIYHLVFQTDYSKLNFWDTIIKLTLERFLIQNAKGNEHCNNNKKRFSCKKITTYLVILKQNKYEIFNWDFEDSTTNEIKIICKNAFIKYFKNHNKELFNYCKFIKQDKSKWSAFKTPFQFLADKDEFKSITYIKNFFNYLHTESKNDSKNVKNITDNFNLFEEKINEYIVEMCETYFGLNTVCDIDIW